MKIQMGVQDNYGFRGDSSPPPYIVEWWRIRETVRAATFKEVTGLDSLSVNLRIGGARDPMDFGGKHGWERRRLDLKQRKLTCDMVVQGPALIKDILQFNKERAFFDFIGCIDYLFEHQKLQDRKALECLRNTIHTSISSELRLH